MAEHEPKMAEHEPKMAEHEPILVLPPVDPLAITRKQKWMTLLFLFAMLVVGVIQYARINGEPQRFREIMSQRLAEQARSDRQIEDLQRKLGCKGDVLMGMCMDPPCIDSDASGPLDQIYVRGSVTSYDGVLGAHQTTEDECIGASDLREGTCKPGTDGRAAAPEGVVIHCDKGCSEGACVR